ncbi:Sel1 domain protein repeat-containing protein, partial [mine drainage metagenome]
MMRAIRVACYSMSTFAGQPDTLSAGMAAYRSGEYATALADFRAAAGKGVAEAQFGLGLMYDKGHGVPQNYAEALKWYRRAAQQGYAA